jgi:hypothetical protein
MGIRSTVHIIYNDAIARIREVDELALAKNYRGIERITFESEENLQRFVDEYKPVENLAHWTNKMLGDYMESPFVRFSMFDNYIVEGEPDEML